MPRAFCQLGLGQQTVHHFGFRFQIQDRRSDSGLRFLLMQRLGLKETEESYAMKIKSSPTHPNKKLEFQGGRVAASQ